MIRLGKQRLANTEIVIFTAHIRSKDESEPDMTGTTIYDENGKVQITRHKPKRIGACRGGKYTVIPPKRLNEHQSEVISDALRIYSRACQVFETETLASDWLQAGIPALRGRPIDLMDTAEGRHWVMDTLERVETGDFS